MLLDRALLHHHAIRYRAHALNASAELDLSAGSQTRELPVATRQRLNKLFTRARKSPAGEHTTAREELTRIVEDLLRERDELR